MLYDNLSDQDEAQLHFALTYGRPGAVRDALNGIFWKLIRGVWNDKIISLWIFKTWRVRDLRALFVKLFGEPPLGYDPDLSRG